MEETKETVIEPTSEQKWEELLKSLVGENVKVMQRFEFNPKGIPLQGKLSQHLSGHWRIHMPAAQGPDPRNPQGEPVTYPAEDVHFSTESVSFVSVTTRLSLVGGA